jgi:hypothetical protein
MGLEEELSRYNWVKSKAFEAYEKGKVEKALGLIYVAATYAWKVHLGLWYDEDLENLLSVIGRKITGEVYRSTHPTGKIKRRVAHIVTTLYEIGGHSRVIKHFLQALNETCEQYVYLTNTERPPSKVEWLEDLRKKGVKIRSLSYNDHFSNRIKQLVEYLERDSPEKVILYIHPNDVIAVAALNSLKKKPYVLFFNHADVSFWLGRNVLDVLLEWRSQSLAYSKKYRKIDNACVIPLIGDVEVKKQLKEKIKKGFHIPTDATVSITIGKYQKVMGDPNWDYFKAIEQILKEEPNHYHISVAVPNKLSDDPDIRKRFIIMEATPHVEPVYNVADFLIETFPAYGGTVRVEAMMYQLPIVAIHNKNFSLLSDCDALPANYPLVACNAEELIRCSSKLIKDENLRTKLGVMLFNYYKSNFDYKKMRSLIISTVTNRPNIPFPMEECEYDLKYVYNLTKVWASTSISKELLQYASRKPSFSLKDRIGFYSTGIINGDFPSYRLKAKGLVFTVIGSGCRFVRTLLWEIHPVT